jgi:predicted outer membrane repeat protein
MKNTTRKSELSSSDTPGITRRKPIISIRPTLLTIAIAQALALPGAQAARIVVDNGGDADVGCTLREAVASMNAGSVGDTGCSNTGGAFGSNDQQISFSVATVSLSNGELDIDNRLTIDGGAGVTINGNGSSRLLNLDAVRTRIVLDSLTLSGGSSSGSGGAIYAKGIHLILSNSTVSGNDAQHDGGGIHITSSRVSLINSNVSGNSTTFRGGGINAWVDSSLSLSNSIVSGNSTDYDGGGLYMTGANTTVSLENSSISANSAYRGGGIYARGSVSVTLSNSSVTANTAYHGSGIIVLGSSMNISNSTVSGNSGTSSGGGIYAGFSSIDLSNSTVSANSAFFGGGIDVQSSTLSLSNSTISGNSTFWIGGGIYALSSTVSLSNSTLSMNAASSAGGIYAGFNSSINLSNSIVANSGSDCVKNASTITADSHNIIEDGSCVTSALSVDPKLGPLANNGGPTKTHALLAGSPAIDAGDNATCAAPPVNNLDQRGETRPVGSACDIGAYEFGAGMPFSVGPLPDGKGGYFFLPL